MRAMLRQFRRAPGRIVASIFALTLAVGAIGVLAIPAVSESTLHRVVADDGLGDVILSTTPLTAAQVEAVANLPNVAAAEGEIDVAAKLPSPGGRSPGGGTDVRIVGLAAGRTMDHVRLLDGRPPADASEALAVPGTAEVGETAQVGDHQVTVVGHGTTLWWADRDTLFVDAALAASLSPEGGTNRLVITAHDDSSEALHRLVDDVRAALSASGDTLTEFPVYLPDGTTPIDADIRQVSNLIGLLGIVAGLVAMVLLASTTNTLITERSREVAVMRALGGRQRALRRRLRRIALAITACALLVGLPLGVVIANLIARMVLEKFVGITPDVTVSWPVLGASVVGMLAGARLVAARAARRVTKADLVAALRDRDAAPFGRSWSHRLLARMPLGSLRSRIALRSSARRPARTVAVVVQIAAAVGAAYLIPSLAASVNAYNNAAQAPWTWESQTLASDPGLHFAQTVTDGHAHSEAGVFVVGQVDDQELDVWGLPVDTAAFDPTLTDGRWLQPSAREAVISKGFAARRHLGVGDDVAVELAGGTVHYRIVGLADDYSRALYTDRADLARDAGEPGGANVIWSTPASGDEYGAGAGTRAAPLDLPVPTATQTRAERMAEGAQGRDAIVVIFGAIGVIVSGVAALAVVSSMTVNLFERRHEFAALQALGARRRQLWGMVVRELAPLAALGLVSGLALGMAGTRGIIASFERSEALDIGATAATSAVPAIAVGTFAVLLLLAFVIVRSASRRPVAVTLRGAA